ncbi:recombinase [Parashewanella spongiae]|uniref:Recombinase n=1 Tax=Parashewanella spongiae TaxID=342950 RepID=A0A3A6TVR1_9GAMM|nr:recombinase [Parashewanella spongiae]MCL1078716.1 recombinase [Parashewanella spongiae]RJY12287.1 recombinase [Parashewanella spongiae]
MAARPRTKAMKHLPEHLYYDSRRGSYRLRLITGRFKMLGKDREMAIAVTKEYNRVARQDVAVTVDSLLNSTYEFNEPSFGDHVDKLLLRIIHEEEPSEDFINTMKMDADRTKEFFATVPSTQITLQHVNDYLNEYHSEASANVHNRKVAWLKKLFSYAMDESLMESNPAALKKKKRVEKKQRQRLKLEWYRVIHAAAPLWLQTAMDLSLQTTHARLEISRIQYNIKEPSKKLCGCLWLDKPELTSIGNVYGKLYIHRQKVADKEAAHVAIPIGEKLKAIIDRSRDRTVSPFVVHRLPQKCPKNLSKDVVHLTQVSPDYISRTFSKIRDKVGCCEHLEFSQRPTFHEIRALAAHLFDINGIDPQSRMAHTDAKSTRIYTQNHIEWVGVPFAEVDV